MPATETKIYISLRKNGLTHAKGKSDKCDDDHPVTVDLADEDLHVDGNCLTEEALSALQKMHEAVHPRGTVSVQYCREPECMTIIDELAWNCDG